MASNLFHRSGFRLNARVRCAEGIAIQPLRAHRTDFVRRFYPTRQEHFEYAISASVRHPDRGNLSDGGAGDWLTPRNLVLSPLRPPRSVPLQRGSRRIPITVCLQREL